MKRKAASKRKFKLNSPAEEARIQAGIKADPDARELTAADFARMEFFRSGGPGWQTRMNAALAEYVKRHQPRT